MFKKLKIFILIFNIAPTQENGWLFVRPSLLAFSGTQKIIILLIRNEH
jgi:hypothetical protein